MVSWLLVLRGAKLGAVGALAASMGTAQALGWIRVGAHDASEMAIPTLAGASLMGLCTLLGAALAPDTIRRQLLPIAGRWFAGALVLAAWGAWLLSR